MGIEAMIINNTHKKMTESKVRERAEAGPGRALVSHRWERTAKVSMHDVTAIQISYSSRCRYQRSHKSNLRGKELMWAHSLGR